LALLACTGCDHSETRRGEAREVVRVTVGDAEVTLSVDVLDHHRPLILRESGGGRGALPTGIESLPSTSYWPVPVVRVHRGNQPLELEETHERAAAFRTSGALDEVGAIAAAGAAVATTCSEGERVVYRFSAPGYDSGFHGVYVRGDLALHRTVVGEADDCAAALAQLPPLDEFLAAQLTAGDRTACARVVSSGGAHAGFECSLRWPDSTPRALFDQLAAGVVGGAAHDPDWETTVFACLAANDPARPGCLAYLASTTTPERRLAFLSARTEECTGPACLPFATLVSEAARLGDTTLCTTVFGRVERLAESGPDGLRDAGTHASALGVCTPAERHEQLARSVFLRDDGTRDDRVFSRCPPEVSRLCRSLSRLGAAYVANACEARPVAESRALLATTTSHAGNASVDAALIVLSRCAPDEARAWLTEHVSSPIPRARELAHFGLAVPGP
jgi:hypothetical protein